MIYYLELEELYRIIIQKLLVTYMSAMSKQEK